MRRAGLLYAAQLRLASFRPALMPVTLRRLIEELKSPGLELFRHDEILDIILANIN